MIPNICHFVFGLKKQTDDFLFCFYLAVYSCYLVNKPDTIYFYYHHKPFGKWWTKLKSIPNIRLQKIEIPTHIGIKTIHKVAHKADKVRMDKLYENGGIYLDIDTICVKPWKELLSNNCVLGKEDGNGICNAIMFTEPKSQFFKLWIDQYETNFDPDGWREASIVLPETIAKQHTDLLTLQNQDVFFQPNHNDTHKIFSATNNIPTNLISLHLWESFSIKYMNDIKDWSWAYDNSHTLYGKIMLELMVKDITDTTVKDITDTPVILPNLHIIHRIDPTNTGDIASNCANYYKFAGYNIITHDIYTPKFDEIKKNDPVILSGGGLLNCLDIWNKNINRLLELSKNVVGWGIGLNRHNGTRLTEKINVTKFKLLGIRDYFDNYSIKYNINNIAYVPCSSCNLVGLNKSYDIKRKIGVYEHHHQPINVSFGELNPSDKINNEIDINKVLQFLGESEIIVTNTYHGLYFSKLMNKKVILFDAFSEKFAKTKFKYTKYTGNINNDILKVTNSTANLLTECIEYNDAFYEKVVKMLNTI